MTDPTTPPTELALSRAYPLYELGRYRDAEQLLQSVLTGQPGDAWALCLMAATQLGQDRAEAALRWAQDAVAADPTVEWAYRIGSIALTRTGRHAEAVQLARDAVRLAPEHPQALRALGAALLAEADDLPAAQLAADRAAALAPDDPDTHVLLGMVAAARGRHTEAIGAFHRALAIDPQHSAALNELARAQLHLARRARPAELATAADTFAAAVRANPQSPVSRRNVDVVLHTFLARFSYAVFLAAYAGYRLSHVHTLWVRALPVLALLAALLYGYRFTAALQPALRSYLRQRLRDPLVRLAVGCHIAAVAAVAGAVALPGHASPVFLLAVLTALTARIVLREHRRRTVPGSVQQLLGTTSLALLAAGFLLTALFLLFIGAADPNTNHPAVDATAGVSAALGLTCGLLLYRRHAQQQRTR